MKQHLVILLLAATFFSACKRQSSLLTEKEAIAIVQRFDKGWKSKNLQLVDSVLAPSYIYFTQSGNTFSRENLVKTAGSNEYQLDSMIRSEYEVELYANTAVVSTRWKGKGVYRNTPFNEDQRCSLTIIKENGKVLVLSEHCTPIKHSAVLH